MISNAVYQEHTFIYTIPPSFYSTKPKNSLNYNKNQFGKQKQKSTSFFKNNHHLEPNEYQLNNVTFSPLLNGTQLKTNQTTTERTDDFRSETHSVLHF